jgi:hypothetical protein
MVSNLRNLQAYQLKRGCEVGQVGYTGIKVFSQPRLGDLSAEGGKIRI